MSEGEGSEIKEREGKEEGWGREGADGEKEEGIMMTRMGRETEGWKEREELNRREKKRGTRNEEGEGEEKGSIGKEKVSGNEDVKIEYREE